MTFHEDNNCYTIEDVDGDTVTDPQGILYMTATQLPVPNIMNFFPLSRIMWQPAARTGFQAIL